jgi:Flp pilus assembly protein TadD
MLLQQRAFFGAGLAAVVLSGFGACAKHTAAAVTSPPLSAMERQIANAADAGDGDYNLNTLRARLNADPRDFKTRLELAQYYQHSGYPEIALEHARLACERAPDSVEAHLALAKMLRSYRKTAEAAAELGEFAAGTGHDSEVEVWAWLGLLRDETGDWVAGDAAHRKAVALAPGRDDLRNNLGYCLLKQGKRDEAAVEFRAALKINAQSVTARNNLGLALLGREPGDSKEALLNWQSVADPATAHNNMAAAWMEQNRYAEARRELELALSFNPQHAAALRNLALISQLDGKPASIVVQQRTDRLSRLRARWVSIWSVKQNSE